MARARRPPSLLVVATFYAKSRLLPLDITGRHAYAA